MPAPTAYKLIASGIPAMPYYRLDGVSYETHVAWIDECVKRGVYLLGYHNHFISTAHTETDIQLTLEIVDEAILGVGAPFSSRAARGKIVIAGYCWPQSGEHSESIDLFCHTTANTFNIEVVRQGAQDKTVLTQANITGIAQDVSGDIAVEGSRWRGGFKLTIAPEWRSGFYLVRLEDADGNKAQAFFVVRSSECADATLVLATSTWNAYNTWGGASYYTGGHVTSPMRPLQPGFLEKADPHLHRIAKYKDWTPEEMQAFRATGYDSWSMAAGWANWEMLFVRWAEQQGYRLNYATSLDLDRDPSLLDKSRAYISIGHDEYWSTAMRNTVENFIDAGGNAAFFSGNTAFWQVRFEADYRQMVGYKCDIELDPMYDPTGAPELSTMWSDPLVGRPENEMTGVSFTRGGYAHMPNSPEGTGGYSVWQPDHWAFAKTQQKLGSTLGADGMVVGYECDGCELTESNGRPIASGLDSPLDFEVLGTATARLWETEAGTLNTR